MTNIIKKITVAILSLIVMAGAFAPTAGVLAATFNNDAHDYPTIQVSNYTRNPGSNGHWSNSVSANAGEVISFLVYYHNTAGDTANGTTLRVPLPGGTVTSATVTGDVRATNASTVSGSVSVSLSSGQTMTFVPGSTSWYPNKSVSPQALPSGQNGSEIVSNGLVIGDIAGGWASQGYVVFRAQISNAGGGGAVTNGSIASVSTNSVYSVTQSSATIQGVVNPNNSHTNTWFEYGTTQSFGSTAGYQTVGTGNSATNISGYLSNLFSNTTYYYRAVAQNAYGTTYGNTLNFTTQSSNYGSNGSAPFVTTNSANSISTNAVTFNGSVTPNNSNTTAWFEYGTTQSLGYTAGYQSVGSNNYATTLTSTIYNLSSNATYYYRVVAQNAYGTTYGSIMSFTTTGGSVGSGNAAYITTHAAQSVFRNSALINGNVNPNGSLTTAWFDWGTTTGFGSRTILMPAGQATYASSYSAVLSGLQAGAVYYYRAVAQNAYGTTYGNTLSFTTTANAFVPGVINDPTPVEPRVIVQQTVLGVVPTVLLAPSIDKKNPNAGDAIEYSIQYRNEAGTPITNVSLKVELPSEVRYDSATLQPSTSAGNVLTFDLGTINANTQGVITIKATVDRDVEADDTLIFGATINYINSKKQFQSATAYLTVMVGSGVAGLASLLSVLSGLFTNWFVDLILGLLIGFGIYHFFVRQKEEEILIK